VNYQELAKDYGTLVILVVLFFAVFILPNIKEQKRRRRMIEALKVGQKVITIGGIFGEIAQVKREYLVLRVLDTDICLTMVRSAIKKVIDVDDSGKSEKRRG
jgi:preprotein translocase subunit YajC